MGVDVSKSCTCALAASKDAARIELKPRPILKTRLSKVPPDSSGSDSSGTRPVVRFSAAPPDRLSDASLRVCAKMRHVLLGAVAHLRLFRSFLKPLYSTPKDAYVALSSSSDDGNVSRIQFIECVQTLGFSGRADWVFETLRDGSGMISRKSFAKGMCTAGTKQWCPERLNFLLMVTAAVTMTKCPKSVSAKPSRSSEANSGKEAIDNRPSATLAERRSFTVAEVETDSAGTTKATGNLDNGVEAKKRRKSDSGRRKSV